MDTIVSIFPENEVVYAPFRKRLFAVLIDGAIITISELLFVQLVPVEGVMGFFLSCAGDWLYFSLQESGPKMATIGKRALGIQVTSLDGSRISFGRATIRNLCQYFSTIFLMIGYLMVLWDDKNQALHDKMAGTLVVEKYV